MRYYWKHITGLSTDFPERFILLQKKNQLQVDVNRSLGRVQITCDDGKNICLSVISNGVILREKEMRGYTHVDVEGEICKHSVALSSLPDEKVLNTIGGNYNILMNFLGVIQSRTGRKTFSPWRKEYWQQLLKTFFEKIKNLQQLLLQIFIRPSYDDFLDFIFALSIGFLSYQINFSFLLCGLSMAATSLFTGYMDWLVRRKQPYLLKIIFLFFPALYISYRGFMLQ